LAALVIGGSLGAGFLWLVEGHPGMDLPLALTLLSSLYSLGVVPVWFMPETKGRPLPE
jgi:hypothetical protein